MTDRSLARSPRTFTTEQEEAHDELLEAAKAALRYLDDLDRHAPEGYCRGNEGRVRAQLRKAIRRQRA